MKDLRHLLRWLGASVLAASGGLWWAKRRLSQARSIVVLAFHRVLTDAEVSHTQSLSGMLLRRATFERLAAHIGSRYAAADLSQPDPREGLAGLGIALTFDDGWADNHTHAFPIARTYGIPIAVFICPGLAGLDLPFWPEQAAAALRAIRPMAREEEIHAVIEDLKSLTPQERAQVLAKAAGRGSMAGNGTDRTLSWEQILEMDRAGMTIGAHTLTHQILTAVPESTAQTEIFESKTAIEQKLNKSCELFAYPNGNHCRRTRQLLAEAGFKLAFTTNRGAWTAACDRLAIPRQIIAEDDVTGPGGRFSGAMFECAVFWRAYRAKRARRCG